MVRKIALEEHFLCPGFEDYWKTTVGNVDPAIYRQVMSSLRDFGEHRLGEMDGAGIERAVLSLAGPGVQIETGTATACRKARECNDFLAKEIQRAAGPLFRLRACAAAGSGGRRRRARALRPRARLLRHHDQRPHQRAVSRPPVALSVLGAGRGADAPIYLHPADPVTPAPVLEGHRGCAAPPGNGPSRPARTRCGSCSAASSIASRRAKLALGHMGETLPFLLWRFDSRAKLYGIKLPKSPSHYIKDNIVVTTSGMCSAEPLACTISALGHEHVMFASDYPIRIGGGGSGVHRRMPRSPTIFAPTSASTTPPVCSVCAPQGRSHEHRVGTDHHPHLGSGARAPLARRAQGDGASARSTPW